MSRSDLRLGPSLTVPVDIASESVGLLGQRGSGKSNAAVVIAEELWSAGVPWVAIDPKGDWYGIRSSADGKGAGLPIPVFGGLHGDVPLEAGAGAYVADLLVEEMLTAVLDVSRLSGGALSEFLVGFCHRLFDRHQAEPHVRTVILEEAHRYIPQSVTAATATLKEATSKIPLEGRAFGLGSIAASQRSSRLHKDVLTQFSTLFAMRSPAKLDRDAIGGWVEEHGVAKELLATLPALADGEAWLWSPHYLGRAERVRFRRRTTFDSGATPKVGQRRAAPRTIADVDLAAIKEAMAETIERAKAADPKELRKQVRDLERRLAEAQAAAPPPEVVEVPVVSRETLSAVEAASGAATEAVAALTGAIDRMCEGIEAAKGILSGRQDIPRAGQSGRRAVPVGARGRAKERPDPPPRREPSRAPVPRAAAAADDGRLGERERRILSALATHGPRTHAQLAILTGYSAKASTIGAGLSELRKRGFAAKGMPVEATAEGLAALGDYEPLPDGDELLDYWRAELGGRERALLDVLVEAWPAATSHAEMADVTGYSPDASTISAGMSTLRRLCLAEKWRLHPDFAAAIGL